MSKIQYAGCVTILLTVLPSCNYIPGTDAYKIERAKEISVRDLIDPSSAQFRDLLVRKDVVCGEINAKNRMGAYVGFKRFFARVHSRTSMIDPAFDMSDKLSADSLCASMRSNVYSFGSSASACERASEKAMEQVAQEIFDMSWTSDCEGKPIKLRSEKNVVTPAAATVENDVVDADTSGLDANMDMTDELSSDEDSFHDAPENYDANRETLSSPLSQSPQTADENWLDGVLGRNQAPQPHSNEVEAANENASLE